MTSVSPLPHHDEPQRNRFVLDGCYPGLLATARSLSSSRGTLGVGKETLLAKIMLLVRNKSSKILQPSM